MKRALFPAIVLCAVCLAATCRAEGINTLMEASKGMDEAKKELDAETAGFNRVKNAVDNGAIQKGQPRQAILNQYGQPVVMNEDLATKRERWVYKPASSSFFEGARITLFFDANGTLDEIMALQ
jgi:hypothetical protein